MIEATLKENLMYRIGFLGLGKMGSAIVNGILDKGLYSKEEVCFYAPSEATQEKGRKLGLTLMKGEDDLALNANLIVLAIEPQKYGTVLPKLSGLDLAGKTIVSLAPGKTIEDIKALFPSSHIARAMPNTPCQIGKGVTTLAFEKETIPEVIDAFASVGVCQVVTEKQIDESIPLQGSMPAYLFAFVKAFADIGVSYGIDAKEASRLALNAIIGSCELALRSGKSLEELIDSVCSRGGATIAGLEELRRHGFIEAIEACYKACVNRSLELKQD